MGRTFISRLSPYLLNCYCHRNRNRELSPRGWPPPSPHACSIYGCRVQTPDTLPTPRYNIAETQLYLTKLLLLFHHGQHTEANDSRWLKFYFVRHYAVVLQMVKPRDYFFIIVRPANRRSLCILGLIYSADSRLESENLTWCTLSQLSQYAVCCPWWNKKSNVV